jgi:hypothetical protein
MEHNCVRPQHEIIAHLVDVVAGKDDVLGVDARDDVDVLEHCIRSALIPHVFRDTLAGRISKLSFRSIRK